MEVPAQFHFTHRRLVEFADTDVAGIMHFSNFFRFVESAEHAFFRSLGFRVHETDGSAHRGWPRIEVSCSYRQPARFEQTLEIALRIDEVRTSSLRYSFWVFVADDPKRSPLATGAFSIIHVEIDPTTRALTKALINPELKTKLTSLLTAAAAS